MSSPAPPDRQYGTATLTVAPWLPAVRGVSLAGVHFHDLRHTGNTLTADAGANLRELMTRMGHTSTRAALVCLHSTGDRQRAIADAVGTAAEAVLGKRR